MATAQLRATAIIEGKDRSSAAFRSAAQNLQRLHAQATRTQSIMSAMGRMAAVGGTALGGALAAVSAKEALTRFAAVERGMTRIGITGDATRQRVAAATSEMRDLAIQTAMSFDEIQKGLQAEVATGTPFDEAMKKMPILAKVAQATNSTMEDTAKTSAALGRHMGIGAAGLEKAFDALATSGKLGEFEFKEMAQYLPKILPMARAIGYSGQEGAERVAAMLQTVRAASGSAGEAATAIENIFQKMESEETANKFKKMGVNLRKEMDIARKNGEDMVAAFLRAADKALKGDMSKLPQLIADMEFGKGTRSLLQLAEQSQKTRAAMKESAGTIQRDFNRVLGDTQTSVDRTTESYDRLYTAVGKLAATTIDKGGGSGIMSQMAKAVEQKADDVAQHGLIGILKRRGLPDGDGTGSTPPLKAITESITREAEIRKNLALYRKELSEIEASDRPLAKKRAERLRGVIGEEEGKLANVAAGRPNLIKYQPISGMAIMSQMDQAGRDEGDRARAAKAARNEHVNTIAPVIETGRGTNVPLPPQRPPAPGAGFSGAMPQGLDVDGKEFGAIAPAVEKAAAAMAQLQGKAGEAEGRAAAIVSEVERLGPAGQQAGAQIGAAMSQWANQAVADVAKVQAALNSLRAPNLAGLNNLGSMSGFNTGSSSGGTD